MSASPSRFQRFLLPGLAFKSVVIGGGYATGRELAEFFLPSGPNGGMMGMLLTMAIWSVVCALTFLFAQMTRSFDYRSFFKAMMGPFWIVFEAAYLIFMLLILSVFGAAAGSIVNAMSGLPLLAGTLALMAGIGAFTAFGSESVERLFKWLSLSLYAVYIAFFILALSAFGDRIVQGFSLDVPSAGWLAGGATYASYNIVCVVMVLPIARHFLSGRDAVIAGLAAGPLAMIPAMLFFVCMVAWYPGIASETLPSDFMLERLGMPLFQMLFQLMIFSALLESGVGAVHAINERVAVAWQAKAGGELTAAWRFGIAGCLLVVSIFIADRFGLVALIAQGYRFLAWLIFFVFLVPLLTAGVWRIFRELSYKNGVNAPPITMENHDAID